MEHNPDLKDDQDVSLYVQRDLVKRKDLPIKIVRDEVVGRFVNFLFSSLTGPYSLSCKQEMSMAFGICPIIL